MTLYVEDRYLNLMFSIACKRKKFCVAHLGVKIRKFEKMTASLNNEKFARLYYMLYALLRIRIAACVQTKNCDFELVAKT